MRTESVADPRRWAAQRCFGIYGQLMDVQACVEDMDGALESDQLPVAKYAGLATVRHVLALRALLVGAVPPDQGDLLADPFTGLPADVVAASVALSSRLARAADLETARVAADAIHAFVREFEGELGFPEGLPSVRRPEGLFPALRLARQVLPINQAAHLPLALPADWLPTQTSGE